MPIYGPKCQFLAKFGRFWAKYPIFWGQGVKLLVHSYQDSNETPFCVENIDRRGSNLPLGAKMQFASQPELSCFWSGRDQNCLVVTRNETLSGYRNYMPLPTVGAPSARNSPSAGWIMIFYSSILREVHIIKLYPYPHTSRLHHQIFKIEYKNHYNHFFTKIRATYYFNTCTDNILFSLGIFFSVKIFSRCSSFQTCVCCVYLILKSTTNPQTDYFP